MGLMNWDKCNTTTNTFSLPSGTIDSFKANNWVAGEKEYKINGCDYFDDEGKMKASTLSLSVLVTIEMFNALNAISEDGSLLTIPPWVNPWLLLAMASSFLLHFFILYVPAMAAVFSIAPHNAVEWILVFLFSFPVIVIDEVLKYVGRGMNESERQQRAQQKDKDL